MFGIGLPELIIIMIVALIVVGPSKLPELAKSIGKAFSEFRRMADDVKETLEEEIIKENTPKEEGPPDGKTEERTGEPYNTAANSETQPVEGEEDRDRPAGAGETKEGGGQEVKTGALAS
jgi:Tat protein translocase TatB subunit